MNDSSSTVSKSNGDAELSSFSGFWVYLSIYEMWGSDWGVRMKREEEGDPVPECAVVEFRKAPPGVDINAGIPPHRDPADAPEPEGLRRAGYLARHAMKWVTDTGVALRRLASRTVPPVNTGPYDSPLSGTTRLAIAGFLLVEIVLLWSLQQGLG